MKSIDKINHHLANIGTPVLNFMAFNGFLSRIFVSTVRLLLDDHRHWQSERMRHVFADIRSGGIDDIKPSEVRWLFHKADAFPQHRRPW